jgi:hypothetical protein
VKGWTENPQFRQETDLQKHGQIVSGEKAGEARKLAPRDSTLLTRICRTPFKSRRHGRSEARISELEPAHVVI